MAEHGYPERTVASPRDPITVGLRVPHEPTGGAAGLHDYVLAWEHGMHVWCGFGSSPGAARDRLSVATEGFYHLPFGKFEKYSPCGTPAHIAESLRPYAEAGCRSFNLIPVADSEQAAIEGAAEVRALLGEKVR